jgi:hypothetical protein
MEVVGYGFIIGCLIGLGLYFVYEHIKDESYQNGYWAGRTAGWKSCLDHQAKVQKMKLEQVFDYDKN